MEMCQEARVPRHRRSAVERENNKRWLNYWSQHDSTTAPLGTLHQYFPYNLTQRGLDVPIHKQSVNDDLWAALHTDSERKRWGTTERQGAWEGEGERERRGGGGVGILLYCYTLLKSMPPCFAASKAQWFLSPDLLMRCNMQRPPRPLRL